MNRFVTSQGIPIITMEDGDDVESITDPICFIVSSKGCFVKKTNRFYTSVTATGKDGISVLGEVKPFVSFAVTKLPLPTFRAIRQFFTDVYKKMQSEVAIMLYYDFDAKLWLWVVPEQKVTAASVDYEETDKSIIINQDNERIEGPVPDSFTKLGSIHSHAGMGAFHSGTDNADEFHFDGLHITIGSFNKASSGDCSYSARWIIAGEEVKTEITEVVADLDPPGEYPEDAHEAVKKGTSASRTYGSGRSIGAGTGKGGTGQSGITNPTQAAKDRQTTPTTQSGKAGTKPGEGATVDTTGKAPATGKAPTTGKGPVKGLTAGDTQAVTPLVPAKGSEEKPGQEKKTKTESS